MNPKRQHPYYYDHGLPFSKELPGILEAQLQRIKTGKASMICIDGPVGSGKTTLAVHVMDYLMGAYEKTGENQWEFKPENVCEFKDQLAMGGADFIKAIKISFQKNLVVCTYDEAGDFSKRSVLTKFNNLMNRVFDTYRAFKVIVIVASPSFQYIDQSLLDKMIPQMLLHCRERAADYGRYDVYYLRDMFWLKFYFKRLAVPPEAYQRIRPKFGGLFLDLPKERSNMLDKYSTRGKFDVLELAEINMDGYLTYAELGAKMGRSYVWIKQKLDDLKVKPIKTHKKVKYFDAAVVGLLQKLVAAELDKSTKTHKDINFL